MEKSGLYTIEGDEIPLRGVEIAGTVLGGLAEIRVRQRYENGERRPVEAIYTFPLPSDATLVGFSMTCQGRRLEGAVKERERAFRDYDDAVMDGHGAALLEQERPNVFTASVGNLLPGEETLIEIAYVHRVQADEGALRVMIPTLVAPRYIPGKAQGDRTADGWADPTDRVPDADRITPRIGDVAYGLAMDLVFDLGRAVAVESPSHRLRTQREGARVRVSFAEREVALDRDVVLVARDVEDQILAGVTTHREGTDPGFFALTIVPDLERERRRATPLDVVFLVDVSGSMEGASLPQAQTALHLCLRHLREGDRFNVIAFQSQFVTLERHPVPFTQLTLDRADAFVDSLRANGGTELLAPTLEAVKQAKDGVIVLLTDGQVGNESEIRERVLAARGRALFYSFGIGPAVSDTLLRDLARATGGGVELIHPGERIDEKVVATFARAVAPRVEDVVVAWDGVEVDEAAPGTPGALVDGEPWVILGRFSHARSGAATIRGSLAGEPFALRVPVDFSEPGVRPALAKLWAAERIRDLEGVAVSGRRERRMRERIVEISVKHGVSSAHTAFLVVETRTGDRRATGAPETRTIPVNAPAGWKMFGKARRGRGQAKTLFGPFGGAPQAPAAPMAAMPVSASRAPAGILGRAAHAVAGAAGAAAGAVAGMFGGGGSPPPDEPALLEEGEAPDQNALTRAPTVGPSTPPHERALDRTKDAEIATLFQRQLASGLWDVEGSTDHDPLRAVRATGRALLWLYERTGANDPALHGMYRAQLRKGVDAVLAEAPALIARSASATDAALVAKIRQAVELALGAAWLLGSPRARIELARAMAAAGLDDLRALLDDPLALLARLDAIPA